MSLLSFLSGDSDGLVLAAIVAAVPATFAYVKSRSNGKAVKKLGVNNTAEHDRNGDRTARKLDELQTTVLEGFTSVHTRMNGIETRQEITAAQVDRLFKERA